VYRINKNILFLHCCIKQNFIYSILLFVWPIILLTISDSWIYSFTGNTDIWIYIGYFYNLVDELALAIPDYKATRSPFLIIGYVIHRLFSPFIANYVFHLGIYYISVFSFFVIISLLFNKRSALFTTIALATYIPFLTTIGQNYPSGIAIMYMLLILLCFTLANKFKHYKILLFFSGIFIAGMIWSQLFTLIFLPFLTLYWLISNILNRQKNQIQQLFYIILGFVSLTCLLMIINYILTSNLWFFYSNLTITNRLLNSNIYVKQGFNWNSAVWLGLPISVAIGGIIFCINMVRRGFKHKDIVACFFQISLLCIIISYTIFEFILKQPILQIPFYGSLLLPIVFIAFGAQIQPSLVLFTQRKFIQLFTLFCFLLVVQYAFYSKINFIFFPFALRLIRILLIGFFAILLIYKRPMTTKKFIGFLLCITIMWSGFAINDKYYFIFQPRGNKQHYLASISGAQYIQKNYNGFAGYYWYPDDEQQEIYRSIISYFYWTRVLISENFPKLPDNPNRIQPGMIITILSKSPDTLSQADKSLVELGYHSKLLKKEEFSDNSVHFTIFSISIMQN